MLLTSWYPNTPTPANHIHGESPLTTLKTEATAVARTIIDEKMILNFRTAFEGIILGNFSILMLETNAVGIKTMNITRKAIMVQS